MPTNKYKCRASAIWPIPKKKWSNQDGDYHTEVLWATIDGADHLWCFNGDCWKPATQFDMHIRGRYAGHYYSNCRACVPIANAKASTSRQTRQADFASNKANGLIVYDGNDPPLQCSSCYYYSNPPYNSTSSPRPFAVKDDGKWYAKCEWCRTTSIDRVEAQLEEEMLSLGNDVVAVCKRCVLVQPKSKFIVRTMAGIQVRTLCATCRPIVRAEQKQLNDNKFATRRQEKNSILDSSGCFGIGGNDDDDGDDDDDDRPVCSFGFCKDDIGFEDLLVEMRHLLGPSFAAGFDYHHMGEKNRNVADTWDDWERNIEMMLCELQCKFCHVVHHALDQGRPRDSDVLEIVQEKLVEIYRNGCGGPGHAADGTKQECPFGFHNRSIALKIRVDELVNRFGDWVVVRLFNNDHDVRTEHRHGTPAAARNLREYQRRTVGCTLRCKMCDAIKTHRNRDNVNLKYMEI